MFKNLDRDGAGRKVIPEEAERRRFILWELLNLDARLVSAMSRHLVTKRCELILSCT